jgi:hypothetical protein
MPPLCRQGSRLLRRSAYIRRSDKNRHPISEIRAGRLRTQNSRGVSNWLEHEWRVFPSTTGSVMINRSIGPDVNEPHLHAARLVDDGTDREGCYLRSTTANSGSRAAHTGWRKIVGRRRVGNWSAAGRGIGAARLHNNAHFHWLHCNITSRIKPQKRIFRFIPETQEIFLARRNFQRTEMAMSVSCDAAVTISINRNLRTIRSGLHLIIFIKWTPINTSTYRI